MSYVIHGRCKSGSRWFWIAAELGRDEVHKCDDPVCIYGGPHEYGWEDTEDLALKAMAEAVAHLGGEVRPGCWKGNAQGRASDASSALKRINAARRKARPPKPGATEAAPVEYLYEPWSWYDDSSETHKGITEIPIVKKTAKRIYYDRTDSWDRHDGVVALGYVSREEFETDTRCRGICERDIPAGPVCGPHGRDFPHCVHFGQGWLDQDLRCLRRGGCGDSCQADTPGMHCDTHVYTWEHCPHGHQPGHCHHGLPAGVADLPGRSSGLGGGTVYATRAAAEEYLFSAERERERRRAEREPDLRRLRMAMADAHPDRGGTNEEFMAARERYERALRQAS